MVLSQFKFFVNLPETIGGRVFQKANKQVLVQ